MNTNQATIPYPLSIDEKAQERAAAGQRIAALLEHPGFDDLRKGIRAYQATVTHQMASRPVSSEAADYADKVGELKGIGMIEMIAAGLVQVGTEAEAEIRTAEEGG